MNVPVGSANGPNVSGATQPITSSNHATAASMSGTVIPTWSMPTRPSCPLASPGAPEPGPAAGAGGTASAAVTAATRSASPASVERMRCGMASPFDPAMSTDMSVERRPRANAMSTVPADAWRGRYGRPMTPYTHLNLEDVDDAAAQFGLSPSLEARFARKPLGSSALGVSREVLAPGFRVPFGHTHRDQEEVYVVVRGSGRMKIDDDDRRSPPGRPRPRVARRLALHRGRR